MTDATEPGDTRTGWSKTITRILPEDAAQATLIGRVWDPAVRGPSPVLVTPGDVYDISGTFATVRDLCEEAEPAAAAQAVAGRRLGSAAQIYENTELSRRDPGLPHFLAPVDLQTLKASGVTFAVSMIERVIEERTHGDFERAAQVRAEITTQIGTNIAGLRPGSPAAARLKDYLVSQGMWSQYLEVGIGPDAEIFTKAPTLSAVGPAAPVGILAASRWNNPEPEVTLVVSSRGAAVGATLGNDVNLRDIEGRSALLLPKAKDNNASCALGPFLRLFDDTFTIDTVRGLEVRLEITGRDGFHLEGVSQMSAISRDPLDLVGQLLGPHHQYPDGATLMLGTMFAPIQDRRQPGMGFTHEVGDIVTISAAALGSLINVVRTSEDCEPWEFGIGALLKNLAHRGLV